MQPVANLFGKYVLEPKRTRRTPRGDLIELFMSELNPPRRAMKLRDLSFPYLSRFFKERKMDEHQIYCFYQDCKRAKNFGSYFWFATRVAK